VTSPGLRTWGTSSTDWQSWQRKRSTFEVEVVDISGSAASPRKQERITKSAGNAHELAADDSEPIIATKPITGCSNSGTSGGAALMPYLISSCLLVHETRELAQVLPHTRFQLTKNRVCSLGASYLPDLYLCLPYTDTDHKSSPSQDPKEPNISTHPHLNTSLASYPSSMKHNRGLNLLPRRIGIG